MGSFHLKLFAFLLFLVSLKSQAAIQELISYDGNACPEGSVQSTATDDGNVISFLFDQFTGATSIEDPFVNLRCQLNVKVQVPEGFRIGAVKALQNAFVSVEKNTYAGLYTQIDGTDQKQYVVSGRSLKILRAPFQDNVPLEIKASNRGAYPSSCAARNEFLVLRSQLFLGRFSTAVGEATGVIDSLDVTLNSRTPSSYEVIFEKCPEKKKIPPKPGHKSIYRQDQEL